MNVENTCLGSPTCSFLVYELQDTLISTIVFTETVKWNMDIVFVKQKKQHRYTYLGNKMEANSKMGNAYAIQMSSVNK